MAWAFVQTADAGSLDQVRQCLTELGVDSSPVRCRKGEQDRDVLRAETVSRLFACGVRSAPSG